MKSVTEYTVVEEGSIVLPEDIVDILEEAYLTKDIVGSSLIDAFEIFKGDDEDTHTKIRVTAKVSVTIEEVK